MILVLGGTTEGREVVKALSGLKYKVIACTTTPYGGSLLGGTGASEIIDRGLNEGELTELIKVKKAQILVDATHPFAEIASINAQNACNNTGILYIRYERPVFDLPASPLVHTTTNYEEAAVAAVKLAKKTIFLTTGTKTMPLFVNYAQKAGKRIVARIIPETNGLKRCLDLGMNAADIIAMVGPVSLDLNKAMLREYKADVLVTKESGQSGGTDTKVEAALELSIPVVVIDRPQKFLLAVNNMEQLIHQIKIGKGSARIG